jgi:putative ubiquitin-RnfH superfamily antitoxin RatB of RatAB toxin-antitoxin module
MAEDTVADTIAIEVVYALPGRQTLLALEVPAQTTLLEAIGISGICRHHPEIDPTQATVGIFGRVLPADTLLRAGDRVEIYRPLLIDPKQARRQRALAERDHSHIDRSATFETTNR